MRSTDVFPSRWIKADDLAKDTTVTIKNVILEDVQGPDGKKKKPVMHFTDHPKSLIVNKTNWGIIARMHGDESDDWKGKGITLTVAKEEAFGEVWPVVRVRPQAPMMDKAPAPGKAPAGPQPPEPEPVTDWRAVAVHFGKCEGQTLGSMSAERLAWWQKEWKPVKPTPENLRLRHALDLSLADGDATTQANDDDVPF